MALPASFEQLVESLDASRTTVTRPRKVVFVCGGPYATSGDFKSLRDVVVRNSLIEKSLPSVQSIIAERATERFKTARGFVDLLQFERVIANVSEGVLLILEGPGAIAELGAFAVVPEIRDKLYVAVDSGLHDGTSFISAGVISYIEDTTGRAALGVRGVAPKDGRPVNEGGAQEIVAGFAKFVVDQPAKRTIKSKSEQVKYCLIYFVLLALRGAYLSQIMEAMARFGYSDIKNQDLRQILLILDVAGWVKERRVGDQPHWFPVLDVNPLEGSFIAGARVQDMRRGLSDIREEIFRNERSKAEEFIQVMEDYSALEVADVAA